MKALRQRRGLEPGDASQDSDIMSMAKQDVFNEYCQWEGLLGSYGYSDAEMNYFKEFVRNYAHLMIEFSREGGILNALNF